ncbi:hypothetical protein Poli38472_004065 [Pythium oligandrum]|uniref:Alpha/beta-hydrolase n=1 Tax=Pythium oligandrum TaxID=41045 RepID=A0A8K1FJQ1_PYTOL|nr:hypothetical protein Poli38472_004065 [Pythium oligandrum]|eukprot:TMW66300.1 hypothetical protein Poli38472_004065 [Pythium oligandrum]
MALSETATQNEIPVKGGLCDITKQEAGYVKLTNKKDNHYFYWYFESRSDPAMDPFVIWLQGGPGCSSLVGLLTENGPCQVNDDLTTSINPFSWTQNANVLWLDQPTNVGFSYSTAAEDQDQDQDDVSNNFYEFLQKFLDKHPELEGRPLFITGESFAGHFIPAVAHKIWQESTKNGTSTARINLQGIAIGNGWTNPLIQVEHALDMINNSYDVSLLSENEYNEAKQMVPQCLALIEEERGLDVIQECLLVITPYSSSGRNPSDIRQPCASRNDPTQCYDYQHISAFLNSALIKHSLNVPQDLAWTLCKGSVSQPFFASGDYLKSYARYIEDLLDDSSIRVLFYVGDADTVCNWYGIKAMITALDWKHTEDFNTADERMFTTSNGSVDAGTVKSFNNQLTFLRVFNAGHMVPYDQPAVALEILTKFLANQGF